MSGIGVPGQGESWGFFRGLEGRGCPVVTQDPIYCWNRLFMGAFAVWLLPLTQLMEVALVIVQVSTPLSPVRMVPGSCLWHFPP